MQQVSYSLYNQPTPPKMQWQATTNGALNGSYTPSSQHISEKMAIAKSMDGAVEQDVEHVKSSEDRVEETSTAQTRQEEPKLVDDASPRDDEIPPQAEETQTATGDQAQSQEVAIDTIKQEVQTPPILAQSPVKASSPANSTPKSAKPRSTQKSERKKVNNNTAKKPAVKKRKIEADSRGDTPASHRSATPNSTNTSKPLATKTSKQNSATPAQSSPPPAEEEADEEDSASDNELFCICRKPDDHTWMIGCDGGCEDWFHGRCVNLQQKDEALIDKYICKKSDSAIMISANVSCLGPNCAEKKRVQTSWKPMCRLEGCRNAARSSGSRPSKYCCDEHGVQYMRQAVIDRAARNGKEVPAKKRRKENYTDNIGNEGDHEPPHLRGGHIVTGEAKGLAITANVIHEFKSLGDSVTTPAKSNPEADEKDDIKTAPIFSTQELQELEEISSKRSQMQHQLGALDDRERFLAMVKSRAKSVLEEMKKKEKNMKDICGFDKRLRWSPDDFDQWRSSPQGKESLKTGVLTAPVVDGVDADGDAKMADGVSDVTTDEIGKGLCQKKRCKQHEGWYKLHSQDLAFDRSDCRRAMQKLEVEEKGIRERAMIRSLESSDGEARAGSGSES